jgi:DNA-binding transcriptional ArsR family regulator
MATLPDAALPQVAAFFQALSEPTRLRILNLLRERPHNVGELAQRCDCTSANISRHLALLQQRGLVARESRGTTALYSIADDSVYALCDLVCGSLARQFERQASAQALFTQGMARPDDATR